MRQKTGLAKAPAERVVKDMNNALKDHESNYRGEAFEASGKTYDPTGP